MSLRSLSDSAVLAGFDSLVRQTHRITAALIAHILEIEHRQLYRDMGCDSMRAFLVRVHHFSEDAAERRLQAAHAVRRHPQLLACLSDGRLHLTAIGMLSAHLDETNAGELIAAATHKTRSEIQALLLARKPGAISAAQPEITLSTGEPAPAQVTSAEQERLTKISIRESTRAKLRHAHDLVAGAVPFGDHDRVIARALDEFIAKRMKRKFAITSKPRVRRATSDDSQVIPAHARRAVFKRDGGQCTFAGPTGHRCESRAVQFDHIIPRARGGKSTIPNLRLRCGPHNQLAAEREFGRDFMERKRAEAIEDPDHRDLISGLRSLGYRPAEAKEAAGWAMNGPARCLEDRMRAALVWLRPRRGVVTTRRGPPPPDVAAAGGPSGACE